MRTLQPRTTSRDPLLDAPGRRHVQNGNGFHDAVALDQPLHAIRSHKSSFGHDQSFQARGSYVHFAQHGIRNIKLGTDDHYMGNTGTLGGYMRIMGWYDSAVISGLRSILLGRIFTAISMISVFVALFFSDIFILLQVPTNKELDIILTCAMVVFTIEWVGLSAIDAFYPLSSFFFMDFISASSMVFDISYLFGRDATKPVLLTKSDSENDAAIFMFVRAARTARWGVRAVRLSRVVKVVRFLFNESKSHEDKMAEVIENKLKHVLSQRVAVLSICIAVVIPLIHLFEYPDMDESLTAWGQILTADVDDYLSAVDHASGGEEARARLSQELKRFADFYSDYTYGPFRVDFDGIADGGFKLPSKFHEPRRGSSTLEMDASSIRVFYDLSAAHKSDSAINIGLILFLVLSVVIFSSMLSTSVITIALTPLERVLSTVRERCAQIFKYATDLQEDSNGAVGHTERIEEDFKSSEFDLLEIAVSKLAAIAHLSAAKPEKNLGEEMTETDLLVTCFTQGSGPTINKERRHSWMTMKRCRTMEFYAARSTVHKSISLSSASDESPDDVFSVLKEAERKVRPDTLSDIQGPDFDATSCTADELHIIGAYVVWSCEGPSDYIQSCMDDMRIVTFAKECAKQYKPNPFHNFAHAVDVAYTVGRMLTLSEAEEFLPEHVQFWLLVSALGHDLGHMGLNNPYLIETSHELAVMYNDRSPLEMMHCSKLFEILKDEEANIFSSLEKDLYREVRKGIIEAILQTDLVKHNEMLKELCLLYQMNSEAFDGRSRNARDEVLQENPQLLANAILHTSDIGYAMKPWKLAHRLAGFLLDEYFAMGDIEKGQGIPVQPLNDRHKVNIPNSQIGVLDFLVMPLVEAVVVIFPDLGELARNVDENINEWGRAWTESALHADAAGKVSARVAKISERCNNLLARNSSHRRASSESRQTFRRPTDFSVMGTMSHADTTRAS